MNYSMISYILGWIFNFEAAFMLLPGITAIIYRERDGLAFLVTMIICLAIGIPLTRTKRKNRVFHAKEGAVTVALSWLVLSIAGALPFVISGSIPHPVDALFETVSGFTTTGASILSDVESLSDDLDWFCDKFDYRNKDADWRTSKDALPRGMQKAAGGYPADEPYTMDK